MDNAINYLATSLPPPLGNGTLNFAAIAAESVDADEFVDNMLNFAAITVEPVDADRSADANKFVDNHEPAPQNTESEALVVFFDVLFQSRDVCMPIKLMTDADLQRF